MSLDQDVENYKAHNAAIRRSVTIQKWTRNVFGAVLVGAVAATVALKIEENRNK